VQFADSGHPLLGDRKYGREQGMTVNLALHALSIDFTHPISGQRLRFTTDLPERFTRLAGSFSLPDSCGGAARLSPGSVA
jgi:tRNA pseudouridine32 synthase/23S rRNA pseudouridine746 synthase/23S rRNA pseudouridine1911/1915/1917 synthase